MSLAKRRLFSAPLRRPQGVRVSLQVTGLEDRTTPAVFTVLNTADSGAGSLRDAVNQANLATGADTITFDAAAFATAKTISLTNGELPVTDSLTIQGTGSNLLTIANSKAQSSSSRIFNIDNTATNISVVLNQMTITGGNTQTETILSVEKTGSGGGVLIGKASVTLNNVVVENNQTAASGGTYGSGGGGIAVTVSGSSLTLNSSIVRNNRATALGSDGGGINFTRPYSLTMNNSTISGNTATDDGGGIYGFDGGTLSILGSTISGNSAGIANSDNTGGGIYTFASGANPVTATITNSTISGNRAGNGGGIYAATGSESLTLSNSTIANNQAIAFGGVGGIARPGAVGFPGKTALVSTILAGNTGNFRDTQGTVQATNSLIGAADLLTISGGANFTGTEAAPLDAKLGPLANNGGPTFTHSLLPGSPAVDAGSNTLTLGADQRGRVRVFGIAADAGSYELIPSTITSFTTAAAPGPINAATFDSKIVFNNPTFGLTAANFGLSATGSAAGTIGTPTSTDNLTWTIPVTAVTGSGSLQLDLINSTGILPGLSATLPLRSQVVAVDSVAPTLVSITLLDPNPTNAASVTWALTFSEPVSGIDLTNFVLNSTGVTGAALTFTFGIGSTWTVTADTGSGDGSLQLDFDNIGAIVDAAGNPLSSTGVPFAGPSYDIDKTAPTIIGITRNDPNPTDAAQISWTVLFSEPMIGFNRPAFFVTTSNPGNGAAYVSLEGSGTTYIQVLSTGTKDADFTMFATAKGMTDEAGNPVANASVAAPFQGETYNVFRESPSVVSIAPTSGTNFTNATEVEWTVKLSKPVTGLSLANFSLIATNFGTSLLSLTGSGDTYTVRATTGGSDGELTLQLNDSTGVADSFGRGLDNVPAIGTTITVDRTPPTITSVVRNGSQSTNAFSVSWTVTFSEAVKNFDASRAVPIISPITGGNLTYSSVAVVNNNPLLNTSYTVTIDGIVGDGQLGIAFDTTAPLTDLTGNPGTDSLVGFPNTQYAIDQTRPTVAIAAPTSTTAGSFPATITLSEPFVIIGPGSVTVTNGTLSAFSQINPTTYTFIVNAKAAGPVTLTVANGVGVDAVGNPNVASAVVATTVNPPAPTVTVTASTAGPTNGEVTYSVRFNQAVTGFSPAKIQLTNGSISSFRSLSGTEYEFVVAPTADGIVSGTILAGAGTSTLNVGSEAATLPSFESDRTKPTIVISRPSGVSDPATSLPVSFIVTFSESVTGFSASDVTLSGTATKSGTATISSFTGSGSVYTVVVDGLSGGTITIGIAADAAVDAAGNGSAGANFSRTFSPPVKQFAVGAGRGGISQIINPTGAIATQSNYFTNGYTSGVRVATGNFTNDGVEDIVVGTGPGVLTNVRVIDGRTGDELFNFQPFEDDFSGGVYVATGDIDGDGIADLIITPDEGGGPRVRGFRGGNFRQIFDFLGIDDPEFRGGARATATDLNGDGRAELVVAAGFGGGPRVTIWDGLKLLSGTTTGSIANFFAFETALRNGVFVSAGDVDGDGKSEIVFGAGPGGGPRVRMFSGAALLTPGIDDVADVIDTQIMNQFAGDVTNRGGIRVLLKDLDGDGRAELVTGAGEGAGSRVTAYVGRSITQGSSPTTLFEFDALPGTSSGVFVG